MWPPEPPRAWAWARASVEPERSEAIERASKNWLASDLPCDPSTAAVATASPCTGLLQGHRDSMSGWSREVSVHVMQRLFCVLLTMVAILIAVAILEMTPVVSLKCDFF